MSNENALQNLIDSEEEIDFDELEKQLENDVNAELSNLELLEEDRKKIGNPETLGEAIKDTIWKQFQAQIGYSESQEFVSENNGMSLDLRDSAHIQTAENFKDGKIATHNYISKDNLEQNYDRFKNTSHKEFRDKFVDPGMNKALPRAGELNKQGVDSVKDIYTGRQIPTETKLPDGKNNPLAAQREHVKPSAEIYKDPSLQMSNSNEELASIINNPENLQGYTTAERNNRKNDNSAEQMESRDKNKHWEEADKKSKEYLEQEWKKGEERLKEEGRKTQRTEAGKAAKASLKAVLMSLLASLLREIFSKLVQWFKSAEKSISTLLESIKKAISSFFANIKEHFKQAASVGVMSVVSMIFDSFAKLIRNIFTVIKQGVKSVKQAIDYFRNPENKNKPFGLKMLEVSKIVIAGITGIGAVALGEVFEKLLMGIPGFAFPIPILGSLANIIGMFLGALVAGIAGAILLNFIDKFISKSEKKKSTKMLIEQSNEVLKKQAELIAVKEIQLDKSKASTIEKISERHKDVNSFTTEVIDTQEKNHFEIENIKNIAEDNHRKIAELESKKSSSSDYDDLMNDLKNL